MEISPELLLLAHALHVLLVIVGEPFGDAVVHVRDIVNGMLVRMSGLHLVCIVESHDGQRISSKNE